MFTAHMYAVDSGYICTVSRRSQLLLSQVPLHFLSAESTVYVNDF